MNAVLQSGDKKLPWAISASHRYQGLWQKAIEYARDLLVRQGAISVTFLTTPPPSSSPADIANNVSVVAISAADSEAPFSLVRLFHASMLEHLLVRNLLLPIFVTKYGEHVLGRALDFSVSIAPQTRGLVASGGDGTGRWIRLTRYSPEIIDYSFCGEDCGAVNLFAIAIEEVRELQAHKQHRHHHTLHRHQASTGGSGVKNTEGEEGASHGQK